MVTDTDGHFYTSEGFGYFLDAGMFSFGGVSLNKYDASGEARWTKALGIPGLNPGDWIGFVRGLGIDAAGHLHLAGEFRGTFVLEGDTLQSLPFYQSSDPSVDIFLASYTAEGALRWIETIASTRTEHHGASFSPHGPFAVDAAGNVYVGGVFGQGAVFGSGQPGETVLERNAAAIACYDTSGRLQWVRTDQNGGLALAEDYRTAAPRQVAVDAEGHLLVTWKLHDTGGLASATVGDSVLTDPGFGGAFVTKYAPDGRLRWVRQFRGYGNEFVSALTADADGNVFVAGDFDALELNLEGETLRKQELQADREDGFAAKYAPDGRLLWTLHAAGRETQRVNALATNAVGDLFVAGEFEQELRLGGEQVLTAVGGMDLFVARYDAATITAGEEPVALPAQATLAAAYPNPFQGQTTLSYTLAQGGPVRLVVYDVLGREVAVLVDEVRPAGTQQVRWDAAGVASGVYVARLETGDGVQSQTLIRVR
ncbi:MAG: T9SS type A sorting domain-containing protein [Bacteroidetes bacterium]|jgi:hypothetical protein|nr:T9SS type A sorting domain-containing protein [Bacteroidota bacterium]